MRLAIREFARVARFATYGLLNCVEIIFKNRDNFGKLRVETAPILVRFYKDDEPIAAKELLLKAVQRALHEDAGNSEELPRLPKRQGENKGKQTADDLLKIFAIIDERNLSDKIPQYTAADLTRIPFVNADSINVLDMAKKIDTLEQRLNSLEQLLTQSLSQSHLSSSVNNEASTSCYEQGDQHTDAVNDARDIHVTDDGNDYSWNIVASRNCPVQQPRKVQPKNSSQAKRGENHTKKRKVFGTARDDDKVVRDRNSGNYGF